MKWFVIGAFVLLTSSLSADRLRDHRQPPSPTFGLPQDTFIVGCELYLFGRFVPPTQKDGSIGHWVRKDAREVCVNGVTVLDVTRPRRVKPDSTISQEVHRTVAMSHYFERIARDSAIYDAKTNSVRYLGEEVPFNKEILICYSANAEPIRVSFYQTGFSLRGAGMAVGYDWLVTPYVPLPPEVTNERYLDGTYHSMVGSIRRGMMVSIVGGLYRTFSSSEEPESVRVRARLAIEKIPSLAKAAGVEWDGRPMYGGLEIGGYDFGPSEVRAFVEAAAGITDYVPD